MAGKVARRAGIAPFYVMEVMKAAGERARAGGDVLHLEVGQPSTPAPAAAIEAAVTRLRTDRLSYTDALGTPELRARIARWYDERYGVAVDPGQVAVTAGASGACTLAFLACFDVGDRVAVTRPGYPCYRHMLRAFGVDVVELPVDAATRFHLSAAGVDAAVAEHGPLDGLVVASPSNPTGTMLTAPELAALAERTGAHGIRLLSDEIYHGITYAGPAPTALAHDADAVVINSFSKYFSMTGWRLGWLVLPPELVEPVERLAQNLTVAPPTLAQWAALAAFDATAELDAHVQRYATNRAILIEGLAAMGFTGMAPSDGAFYLWVDLRGHDRFGPTPDSEKVCAEWLDELGVAATPGIDFEPIEGSAFVRFSFAGATEEISEAVRRLGQWIRCP